MTTDIEPVGDWLTEAPWRHRKIAIIAITAHVGVSANTLDGKRALLQSAPDLLLAAWTGQYTTSHRYLTADDAQGVLGALA